MHRSSSEISNNQKAGGGTPCSAYRGSLLRTPESDLLRACRSPNMESSRSSLLVRGRNVLNTRSTCVRKEISDTLSPGDTITSTK